MRPVRSLACLVAISVLAACGGSSGGGGVTVTGRLVVAEPAAQPQRVAPAPAASDREPDTVLCVRLGFGDAIGAIEERGDVDVHRRVASRTGPVTVSVAGDAAAVLHDLARGRVARTLDLEAGDAYDVVVSGATGGYRAAVRARDGDRAPAALPDRYRDLADGFEPGEFVAAPAAGWDGARLAARYGVECLEESPTACRLRAPAGDASHGGDFAAACALAVRCAQLEADGVVRYAEPNVLRRLAAEPDDELFPAQWAMEQIGARQAWDIARDAPDILIGFIDSGVRSLHPDLEGRVVDDGYDFRDDDDNPGDPTVGFSHGTQVAGVLAAATNNGIGLAGMIWDGRVLAIRAFGTNGFGNAFDIAEAIRYGAGLQNVSGTVPVVTPRILNLSFASTAETTIEFDAVNAAKDAGVFVVAAMGNAGRRDDYYPAAYSSVFAVGATNINGVGTDYSNIGEYVDIAAPGGDSIRFMQVVGIEDDGFGYPFVEGTSFATPLVCATAALMLTLREATPDELADMLRATAVDIGAEGRDDITGFGRLDAFGALLAAAGGDAPVLAPGEAVTVRLLRGEEVVSTVMTSTVDELEFSFAGLAEGEYRIVAGTDRDRDGVIEGEGEISGSQDFTLDPQAPPGPIEIVIRKR